MALYVIFGNISNLAPVSDYEVYVFVNSTRIYTGRVEGHLRMDGWQALVKRFAAQLPEGPPDEDPRAT